MRTASEPGDLVVNPSSGSATTGVVYAELGCRYLGIERNPTYAERSRPLEAAGRPVAAG